MFAACVGDDYGWPLPLSHLLNLLYDLIALLKTLRCFIARFSLFGGEGIRPGSFFFLELAVAHASRVRLEIGHDVDGLSGEDKRAFEFAFVFIEVARTGKEHSQSFRQEQYVVSFADAFDS